VGQSFTVSVEGLPETKALLDSISGRPLQNRTRRALRAGGKVVRTEMRAQARGRGDLPKSMSKTRTRAHRNPLGISISPVSPLSTIFEGGADSHQVAPTAGGILAGPAGQRGRGAAFFARGAVQHPGMAARPLIAPVFDASEDRAFGAFGDVLFAGIER
jgi:hypothetical protein